MKLLFLDIDGVLNSTTYSYTYGCGHAPLSGIKGYTPQDFVDLAKLNIPSLNLINGICKETECKVVITSTWRINCSDLLYWNALFYFALAEESIQPSIDVIACTGYNNSNRGREIQDFLDSTVHSNYIVVDDDDGDISEHHPTKFVHVDGHVGFSFTDYEKSLEILKD